MGAEPLSDEEVLATWRAEPGAPHRGQWLDELFRRHYERVVCWCLRMTGDQEAAADLAQDVLLKAYRHLDAFQGNSKFSTWLFSIARNHFLDERKARSTRPEVSGEAALREAAEGSAVDPQEWIQRDDSVRILWELIQGTLSETEREVLTLHYVEGLSLDAITRLLRLQNPSGAKAYVVSAKRKLNRAVRRLKARDRGFLAYLPERYSY